jgi:hypothetical protein
MEKKLGRMEGEMRGENPGGRLLASKRYRKKNQIKMVFSLSRTRRGE